MKNFKYLFLFLVICFCQNVNAQDPTVQASNVVISSRTESSLVATYTRGNGSYCMVVCKPASSTYSYPIDGTTNYTASSTYGNGSNLGNSNYVIYKGTASAVGIYGLSPSTNYTVIVYEYNQLILFGTNYYYLTSVSSSNTESAYTLCTEPVTNNSNGNATSINYTSATLSWTNGSGAYTLVGVDNYSTGSSFYNPTDGTSYSSSTIYGSGTSLSGDNYVVYNSTGTSVSVTNLLPATNYRFYAFSYCGSSTGSTWNYKTNGPISYSFTTLNYPPTLDAISNITLCQNSGTTPISLTGISDGSTLENQTVSLSVSSTNSTLFPSGNMSISYTSPNTTGTLNLTPATGQYGTATITVTANDGFASTPTLSRSFTVTVNPFPSAAGAITGTTTVCKNGTNYIYSVPAITNATAYSWSFPSGTVIVSGATTNSITVNFPASMSLTTGNISVYGTNTFGCGNGASSSKTLIFDAAPTVSAAGADQVICNGTTQLQGNLPAIGSGIWTVAAGSAAFNSNTQNNTNVTGIASGQTVLLNWTISNGVCPSSVDQVSIFYNPAAPQCLINADFSVSNTTPCVNTGINFIDNSVGATGWTWNFGPNATPSSSTLQNPTGIVFNTSGTQTITLTITGPNGSDVETKNNYINAIAIPGAASAISGNTTVCEGDDQILYSISALASATSYIWTLPSGATINSGANTEAISIDYNLGSASGTLSVQGSNSCGTGTLSNLGITVNPLPDFAGSISGNTTVCQGESNVVYTVGTIANATGYVWSLPSGVTLVQDNGNSITVDFTNGAVSGDITVYGTNACGDGDQRTLTITVNPLPGAVSSITGTTNITNCPISNGIVYEIDSVAYATSYLWNLPNGATIVSGLNTDSIVVDFDFNANSGNIAVMPQNACGNGTPLALSIVVDQPVDEAICLVSADETSDHNIIVWEKDMIPALASYNIYREITTNNYSIIANIHKDSLSEYHDTASNPNATSYKYKITAVDICGNESDLSNYHSTIHLQFLGNGNLQWTLYEIENSSNPVDFYEVFRDDSTTGNWNSISSTIPGGNSTFTDVDYANFTNPSYRVDVIWSRTCTSSRAGVNTSRSNVKNAPASGLNLEEFNALNNLKLYPNPANNSFMIDGITTANVSIFNSIGQLVYSGIVSNKMPIDIADFANGIYSVKIEWNNHIKINKLIKN